MAPVGVQASVRELVCNRSLGRLSLIQWALQRAGLGGAGHAWYRGPLRSAERRMVIRFVRSGGLVAAPGLQVRAWATLDQADGGDVRSEDGYHRRLDEAEGRALLADGRALSAADRPGRTEPARRPDAYRFRFTIESSAGTADLHDGLADADLAQPAFARLVEWASREADAVVRWRIARAGHSQQ